MPECDTCESFITSDFARVFGDNDDQVEHCPDCSTYRKISQPG